ncbi:MAG: diguanylate cyclase [Verrucomicrobia bacterium]|nr:diguanylate cyclase [Verrucomicrobiota bacterium]
MASTFPRDSAAVPAGVLIVDDEEPARSLVRRALPEIRFQVREAGNLSEARHQLDQNDIELALCDLSLGSENGLDLLEEICQADSKTAAVVVTSNDDARTAIACLRSGAYDYLLKPYSVAELRKVVVRTLERHRARVAGRDLRRRLTELETFSRHNPHPILQIARDGTVRYANLASRPILEAWGIRLGDVLPTSVHPVPLLFSGQTGEIEVESGGRSFALSVIQGMETDFVYLHGPETSGLVEARRQVALLRNEAQTLAFHDTLTGLPNRLLMEHRFESEMARCDRDSPHVAMVFVDLDRFKQINDTRGHRTGDQVLVSASKHMSRCLGGVHRVTRWGGDEMVLMLPGVGPGEAHAACERLKVQVQNLVTRECGIPLTMSMGVAIYPDDGRQVDDLVHAADAALLEAKRVRNKVVVFGQCPELRFIRHENALRPLLARTVARSGISLRYEPVADLATGNIVGMEAHLHWHRRDLGPIPEKTILALAETGGFLDKLFRQVIRQGLRHTAGCRGLGHAVDLTFRLPARIFSRPDFVSWLAQACARAGLPTGCVFLEISRDGDFAPDTPARQCGHELSRAGFPLSRSVIQRDSPSLFDIDQTGTRELRIDARALPAGEKDERSRVATVAKIAKTLGMGLRATGVENREQLALLREIGVDRVQGPLIAEAVSAAAFTKRLGPGS